MRRPKVVTQSLLTYLIKTVSVRSDGYNSFLVRERWNAALKITGRQSNGRIGHLYQTVGHI